MAGVSLASAEATFLVIDDFRKVECKTPDCGCKDRKKYYQQCEICGQQKCPDCSTTLKEAIHNDNRDIVWDNQQLIHDIIRWHINIPGACQTIDICTSCYEVIIEKMLEFADQVHVYAEQEEHLEITTEKQGNITIQINEKTTVMKELVLTGKKHSRIEYIKADVVKHTATEDGNLEVRVHHWYKGTTPVTNPDKMFVATLIASFYKYKQIHNFVCEPDSDAFSCLFVKDE